MRSRRALLAAAVALVAVLAGCTGTVAGTGRPGPAVTEGTALGPDGGDASNAVRLVQTDMEALPHGFGVTLEATGLLSVDARYRGSDGRATVRLDDQPCEIVGMGSRAWARAGAPFWAALGQVDADQGRVIDDRWVEVTGPIEPLRDYVDAHALLTSLSGQGVATFGPTSTAGGRRVQTIHLPLRGSITVTLRSPHVIVGTGTDGVRFTYPDDDLSVTPPSGAIPFPS